MAPESENISIGMKAKYRSAAAAAAAGGLMNPQAIGGSEQRLARHHGIA